MTQLDLQQRIDKLEKDCFDVYQQFNATLKERYALQQQVNALAAENLEMKDLAIACSEEYENEATKECKDEEKVAYPEDTCRITFGMIRQAIKTPATDAIKRQWMAELVPDKWYFQLTIAIPNLDNMTPYQAHGAAWEQCRAGIIAKLEEKGHE